MAGQSQPKGAGQAAGDRFVTFSRGAAQRIAKVVRQVEGGNREQGGLTFDHPMPGNAGKMFRVCTFTGSWTIGSSKVVTFKNQTSTPNTASATNLFFPITQAPASARDCAIAKDGTAWYLIDVPLKTATAVFVTGTATQNVVTGVNAANQTVVSGISTANQSVMSDVSISASLNTNNCTITIGKTATTANVSVLSGFSTTSVTVLSGVSTSSITVATSTATGTYLALDL